MRGSVVSRPLLAWLGVLLLGFVAFLVAGTSNRLFFSEVTREPVVVDPAGLDLGETWASEKSPSQIRVRNVSDEPIRVELNVTCGCSSLSPDRLDLRPDEEAPVDIVYDSLNSLGFFGPDGKKSFNIELLGTVRGRLGPPIAWSLRGVARKSMEVEPAVVSLGELAHSEPPQVPEVRLWSLVDVESVVVATAPGWLHAEVSRQSGREFRLVLEPVAPLPPGELADHVLLQPTTAESPSPPPIRVPITGSVQPNFVAIPAAVYFECQPLGSTARETITIQSATGVSFDANAVPVESAGLRVARIEVDESTPDAEKDIYFSLEIPIREPGRDRAEVCFEVKNLVTGQCQTISVPVVWSGAHLEAVSQ